MPTDVPASTSAATKTIERFIKFSPRKLVSYFTPHTRSASRRRSRPSAGMVGRYDLHVTETEVYGAIGEAGFTRLVGAFYAQVPGDDILGPMYAHGDLPGAEERLRDFLVFRFGGPTRYAER